MLTEDKTLHNLNQLIKIKDERIDSLEMEIESLKSQIDAHDAMIEDHWLRRIPQAVDSYDLPVPRLQLEAIQFGSHWYSYEWRYDLIYKHLTGIYVTVPLGYTLMNGGQSIAPINYETGEIYLPFRDGAHIRSDMEQLHLPAFAIIDGKIMEIKA